ncbi:MAG: DUF1284 domain-containing protein [Lachnospiraceae bacterium]|nr:DUF1284 domain-containing protein [Lachnospiraceae bacterium]
MQGESLPRCSQKERGIPLRPHHGMCLAYFEGKGYSEGFTAHMQKTLDLFMGDEAVLICLVTYTDEICTACPNNEHGTCRDAAKVLGFDMGVLKLCGLEDGQILEFGEFARLVQKCILSVGKREEICGARPGRCSESLRRVTSTPGVGKICSCHYPCQWDELCSNRKSRWDR